jgi:hypothetical protein
MCKNDNDKFLMMFILKKLSLIQGKLLVYCNDIMQAYKLKFFFNRFHMKAFVLAPEMAKQQITSVIHFYQIGQFDILIALNSGYPQPLPPMKEVNFIVNFEMTETYTQYKLSGAQIEKEEGCVINFATPAEEKKNDMLNTI